MKYFNTKWPLLFIVGSLIFSCIRKQDFALDKVKWDDITPAWGLPLVNSTLSVDDALNKNNSSLLIQRDPDGFITFIYLDTVRTPTGDVVLDKFKLSIPTFHDSYSLGNVTPLPPPGTQITLPQTKTGSFDFALDSMQALTRVTFKSGSLQLTLSSLLQHKVSFTLSIPNLKDAFGTSYSTDVQLIYNGSTLPTVTNVLQDLSGYSITSTSGNNSSIGYTIQNIKIVTLSTNGVVSNPIKSTDSILVDLQFQVLKLKFIQGKFFPITIGGIPSGITNINAFDNALTGNISFENPSMDFTFQNSYGLTPLIRIDSARMEYAYGSKNLFKDFKAASGNLNITGTTTINPATIPGQFTTTPTVTLDKTTSNIVDVLQGAPNKFFYQIGQVGLSGGTSGNAFISDDSQIQVNTEVKIPLFGSVRNLIIADTSRGIKMPDGRNVDYIEFRAGSENSIPASVQFQAYFADTNLWHLDSTKYSKYYILDSLVSPVEAGLIIAPGDILETDNSGNITKTKVNSFSTSIPVSKEKYNRISSANVIIIKGTMFTKDSSTDPLKDKNVKFFTWQTCTFHLAAFAILRINPRNPQEITNIGQ